MLVEDFLESQGLERMEWPAQSSDLNPIEHVWKYLASKEAASSTSLRSLHHHEQGLVRAWSSIPTEMSENFISSMGNRCRQCVAVRGGHISY